MRTLILLGAFPALLLGQGCPILPADNIWNTRIDHLPVHPSSQTWVNTIGASKTLRADFGAGTWNGGPIGIPYILVDGNQPAYPATFVYQSESDPGPYRIPLNAPIEGGSQSTGDRHAISIDTTNCRLYEIFAAHPETNSWRGGSGAIYDLRSNALRPAGWTSADAAGLPIFPGLVRYDEILAGEIRHAIRLTVDQTQRAYLWPARHYASTLTGAHYPPMGVRFRLRADFNVSGFSPVNQIILTALKRYGLIIADNGSSWFFSGAPDARWNDQELRQFLTITGSNLEAVDVSSLMIDPNSGQARQTSNTVAVAVSPTSATVEVNQQRAFTATVTGTTDARVTWDVNGIVGGSAAFGYVDSITGLYTAPAQPVTATVRATSTADPSARATAAVTVVAPTPQISVSLSPSLATLNVNQQQAFSATVTGTTDTRVTWDVNGIPGGSSAVGFINSATGVYTAPATATVVTLRAVSVANPSVSATAIINVTAPTPTITVSIAPTAASIATRQTLQFTVIVSPFSSAAVTWSVNGILGGNGQVGTISSSGLYRAPNKAPAPVTVRATSVEDPTKSDSALLTITKK